MPLRLAGQVRLRARAVADDPRAAAERRSYSICAPPGARPRVGVREVAGGVFSGWLVDRWRRATCWRCGRRAGTFTPDLAARAPRADRGGVRHHAGAVDRRERAGRAPGDQVTLLYGNRRTDSVMFADELADLKDALPRADLPGPRALPRAAGGRAVQRPPGRRKLRSCCRARRRRPRSTSGGCAARSAWSRARAACSSSAGCARAGAPRAVLRRGRRRPPGYARRGGPGPGAEVTVLLDGRSSTTTLPAGSRSWTAPSGSARTCRSPARAGSAAPAGPGSSRARSPCAATSRWSTPSSTRATC